MKKKVCMWLDSNVLGNMPMRDGKIYACCTKSIPVLADKKYDYSKLTYEVIQKNRIALYEAINNGTSAECENCNQLYEKDEETIDIGKIGYLIYHPHTTCNLKCRYCFFTHDEQLIKLDENVVNLYTAVKNFDKIGLLKKNDFSLELGGGEPLLFNHVKETIKFLEEEYNNPEIVWVSNFGINKKVDELIETLMQRKIRTSLKTSIDCGTPSTYKAIRGADIFYNVVNNLAKSANAGIFDNITLKYILLEDNSNISDEDIFGFLQICKMIKAKNPHKTSVIIDADMMELVENKEDYFSENSNVFHFKNINEKMLRAAGLIYYYAKNILDLEIIWHGVRISSSSEEGWEDVQNIIKFSENYTPKAALELYYTNILTADDVIIPQKENFKPTFIQKLFSLTNEGKHKVLRVLGVKLKIKRKDK